MGPRTKATTAGRRQSQLPLQTHPQGVSAPLRPHLCHLSGFGLLCLFLNLYDYLNIEVQGLRFFFSRIFFFLFFSQLFLLVGG